MGEVTDARRQEATRAFVRYFLIVFAVVAVLSGFTAYAVINARGQKRESRAIRIEYCHEIEKLKADNRADVDRDRRNFGRNLRLLGIADTPELRQAAREGWEHRLERNAPRACPYTTDQSTVPAPFTGFARAQ